jgi:hypothetical protein
VVFFSLFILNQLPCALYILFSNHLASVELSADLIFWVILHTHLNGTLQGGLGDANTGLEDARERTNLDSIVKT